MVFRDNLVVKNNKGCLILNLFSFRRETLNDRQEKELYSMIKKDKNNIEYSATEKLFLNSLEEKGQVLPKSKILEFDDVLRHDMSIKHPRRNLDVDYLIFNLTFDCNFKCYYCYLHRIDTPQGCISIQNVDKITEYLEWYKKKYKCDIDIKNVLITGGEPLTSDNFRTIEYIANMYKNAKITIKTNGTNLATFLEDYDFPNLYELDVSLDGIESVHTKRIMDTQNKFTYGTVIKAIKRAINKGIRVQISSVIDKYNYRDLPSFIDYLVDETIITHELCNIAINTTFDQDNNLGIDISLNNEDTIIEMKKYLSKSIPLKYQNILYLKQLPRIESVVNRGKNVALEKQITVCKPYMPYTMCFIPGGDVYFEDFNGKANALIGNYEKKQFYADKISKLTQKNIFSFKKCTNCIFRILCSTGCPKDQFTENNVPKCGIYKNNKLMDNIGILID